MTALPFRLSFAPLALSRLCRMIAADRSALHRTAAWRTAWLVGVLPLGLAACGMDDSDTRFAPTCPAMHIPTEVGDYYSYAGNKVDFSHLIMRASITHLGGDCMASGPKGLKTRVGLHIVARRGPAPGPDTITLPWFVAVIHNDKIVGKHVFHQDVTFPENVSSVALDTRLATVDLPIKPTNGVNDYRFEVGFQLTPAELNYNREHGVTAQFEVH